MRHRLYRALVVVLGLDLAWHLLHIGALAHTWATGEQPTTGRIS